MIGKPICHLLRIRNKLNWFMDGTAKPKYSWPYVCVRVLLVLDLLIWLNTRMKPKQKKEKKYWRARNWLSIKRWKFRIKTIQSELTDSFDGAAARRKGNKRKINCCQLFAEIPASAIPIDSKRAPRFECNFFLSFFFFFIVFLFRILHSHFTEINH